MLLDAADPPPTQSRIAAAETDEQAAFACLRTRMLEGETRPEIAAALFALRWEDLLPELTARLRTTPRIEDPSGQ